MMLPRQSTTVPNTSNSSACTSALAAMGDLLGHSVDETVAPLGRRHHAVLGAAEQGDSGCAQCDRRSSRRAAAAAGAAPPAARQTPPRRRHTAVDGVELGVGAAVDQHEIGLERLGIEPVVAEQRLAERRLRGREAERERRCRASARTAPSREHSTHTPSNTISALSSGKRRHAAGRRDSCRAASRRAAATGWRRGHRVTLRGRSARDGAGSGRPARSPSWPRRRARRGCRRRGRAGPWWRSRSRCRSDRWCGAA